MINVLVFGLHDIDSMFFILSFIRETVTDNTKNVELQTETVLQEDLDTQKTEYTPTVYMIISLLVPYIFKTIELIKSVLKL